MSLPSCPACAQLRGARGGEAVSSWQREVSAAAGGVPCLLYSSSPSCFFGVKPFIEPILSPSLGAGVVSVTQACKMRKQSAVLSGPQGQDTSEN